MKISKDFIIVSLLVVLDQIIKVYIYLNHLDKNVDIIKNILAFYPKFNKDYSWVNSLFQFGIGLVPHIIFSCLVLLAVMLFYDFLKTKKKMDKMMHAAFLLIISGAVCSLTDKVVWGGSLDYMYLKGFFIFDLKDVYVGAFEVLIIITAVRKLKNVDEKKLVKEFAGFLKEKYLGRKE